MISTEDLNDYRVQRRTAEGANRPRCSSDCNTWLGDAPVTDGTQRVLHRTSVALFPRFNEHLAFLRAPT